MRGGERKKEAQPDQREGERRWERRSRSLSLSASLRPDDPPAGLFFLQINKTHKTVKSCSGKKGQAGLFKCLKGNICAEGGFSALDHMVAPAGAFNVDGGGKFVT